jgi:2-polyprenyl-3-methyl-5-hydroxy-6-metoxy-1,4-benzoquinol methylase
MSDYYRFPAFGDKRRVDACSLCNAREGKIAGRMNYAELGEWDVVQCLVCGLVSFDPIPGIEVIKQGCNRLYLVQQSERSRQGILRYFSRSYRRGGHFALHYLRKLGLRESPALLEIGAGNGYFSQGIRRIYPGARIHYLDVMVDLLPYYREHFDCEAVAAELSTDAFPNHRFDLVIARDILEHVRNPVQTLRDICAILNPGGLLFFITPNGREDFWVCSQRFKHANAATLIWQNHFHYFLPETLERMLLKTGFQKETAFKWNLSLSRKGAGQAEMPELTVESPPKYANNQPYQPPSIKWAHDRSEVTGSWRHNLGILSQIYSAVVDRQKERVDFFDSKGKEFFVIVRKA